MAELMARHKTTLTTFKKGDVVSGILTKLSSSEITVDIDGKTEAIVLEHDRTNRQAIMSALKVGDRVQVSVLSVESESGQPVVSLRGFMDELAWKKLAEMRDSRQTYPLSVTQAVKGGLIVATPVGIEAFLPQSHVSAGVAPQSLVGTVQQLYVTEVNRQTRKCIVSHKPTLTSEEFRALTKSLKVGDVMPVMIAHISPAGMVASLTLTTKDKEPVSVDGFIHANEASWETVDITSVFHIGETHHAKVTRIDGLGKRIELSLRQTTQDPYQKVLEGFIPEQTLSVTIGEASDEGIMVDLHTKGVEGMIRSEKIPAGSTYTTGEKLSVSVTDVDMKRRRVYVAPILAAKPLFYR
jgi:small subunit ribosomal protein S1